MLTLLILFCFMPALVVFGFVKIYKNKLALNPTKSELIKYFVIYMVSIMALVSLVFVILKLISS